MKIGESEVMPLWLSIVIAVTGLLGTVLGIVGFSAYWNERMKHKAQKRNDKEDKAEEEMEALKHKKYVDELKTIITNANAPILAEITAIRRDLSLNTKGTVTILRNDMKKSLDFCKDRGYATSSDKANWNELYTTYAELGGNHFREYVDVWKQEMDSLPIKKKTRQKLNEKK